ncbi:hypothetical protein HYFRA_00004922 [Hymenoscyphus fraxineus]|uniref:Uncharacterized protein n=1 Tax=Hymenoscyphus fraxineus TaxID=746836 RepID=A0A9N9PPC3_9HELO|nr:hypothetical protein HYFRA_00004922 [Hymenoscyphus fraxineus]
MVCITAREKGEIVAVTGNYSHIQSNRRTCFFIGMESAAKETSIVEATSEISTGKATPMDPTKRNHG